jgi:hypothetical protein
MDYFAKFTTMFYILRIKIEIKIEKGKGLR